MVFTNILIFLAIINFCWLILGLGQIPSIYIELGYANKVIKRRLFWSFILLLGAAYRIWG